MTTRPAGRRAGELPQVPRLGRDDRVRRVSRPFAPAHDRAGLGGGRRIPRRLVGSGSAPGRGGRGLIMDLALAGKVAVVTGASKGIGLAITRALADEGALVVAGARTHGQPRRARARERGGGRPGRAGRTRAARAARAGRARPRRRAGQQRRRRPAAPGRVPRDERRRVRVGAADELLHRAARDPRRGARHGRAGRRRDRQRRLGQRVLPARRRHDRLRRREGRAREPQQVAGAGVRAPGHPRQLRLARARSPPTCGSATTASPPPSPRPPGVDADTARANVVASIGGFATGRFTTPEEVATLVVLLASERTANVTGANYVIDGGLIKTT